MRSSRKAPYTSEDLNYSNDDCRANQEQNDPAARPAITGTLENPEDYDVVFLGYPIWWGQAPKVIYTFLESCDFGNATIVPFGAGRERRPGILRLSVCGLWQPPHVYIRSRKVRGAYL